jgi:hypothetical protein
LENAKISPPSSVAAARNPKAAHGVFELLPLVLRPRITTTPSHRSWPEKRHRAARWRCACSV